MSDENSTKRGDKGNSGDKHPASPCISVCVLDGDDVCQGCFRDAREIADWFMADAQQKRDILAIAAARRAGVTRIRLD